MALSASEGVRIKHERRGTEATLKNASSVETRLKEDLEPTATAGAKNAHDDPQAYYTAFYNQFANVIMISTFTGGVQAAVLSFMNDLLSAEPLKVTLWRESQGPYGRKYSTYSLGLMLGLLAIALNLTVAAIAAVNAALASHLTLHRIKSNHRPSMPARIVFCMIIQFMASGLAGMSLILLSIQLDIAFAIVAAVLFFAGILIAGYQIIILFGNTLFDSLKNQPLHVISLVIATTAFIFEVVTPSQTSWFTITTYGFTVTYHILAVLHNTSHNADRPRRLALFGVVVIAGLWGGCVIITGFMRYNYRGWDGAMMYVVCISAGLEMFVLLAIGGSDFRKMRESEQKVREQAARRRAKGEDDAREMEKLSREAGE